MLLPHSLEDYPSKKNDGDTAPVGRRPCAVYDYGSAVQQSAVINNSSLLLPQSNVGGLEREYHHATLDGLYQHAIVRLWALIREKGLKRARLHGVRRATAKESNESGTGERDLEQFENDENRSNANGSPTVITDKSREQESNGNSLLGQKQQTATKRGNSNNIVHDAIA
eukprot:CAMPEP_0202030384 /NCGR_PEP_ID=MMETSP0905-20130828/64466_1 /ASSEMBLY_ACC=CAM_ASM_000554 /TAXON_ID=420261 /ORGANISM="Thalassiosira antarctica, Strain CCMP982" /LENGTH=168 /DNA_ID=CAMNT_0048594181 /DNA_START=792 /DNA_END=1294 /DNA_ORIENTATION=-